LIAIPQGTDHVDSAAKDMKVIFYPNSSTIKYYGQVSGKNYHGIGSSFFTNGLIEVIESQFTI